MAVELRWIASSSASCWYATEQFLAGHALVSAPLAAALASPAEQFRRELAALGLEPAAVFRRLLPLSAGIENNRQLAAAVLTKLGGRTEPAPIKLVVALDEVERAVRGVLPEMVEKLELRVGPLLKQGKARGPGLLAGMGRLTEPGLLPSAAQVVLVYPALGGGGEAHLASNSICFEAVLANSEPALPEVLRLAWLLARLQQDLPAYSEALSPGAFDRVERLAMVAPTLAAGAEVELCIADEANLARALATWRVVAPENIEGYTASVWQWWQTYQESPPRWSVALQALDRLLAAGE
jgi:hypothetical protein